MQTSTFPSVRALDQLLDRLGTGTGPRRGSPADRPPRQPVSQRGLADAVGQPTGNDVTFGRTGEY
ncbi:hypothetical protein P1P68_02485 [Streptomyces scabiei]|uniref:hypothetical protein n=1 Tax=Streptomyces scabiei TaxID=1930 RepID=UPI00298FC4DA|nr:hypothetical protein [Streptomyces scabiei]MDW8803703.1 hypothetical protein [Streptomyces scabiei]